MSPSSLFALEIPCHELELSGAAFPSPATSFECAQSASGQLCGNPNIRLPDRHLPPLKRNRRLQWKE